MKNLLLVLATMACCLFARPLHAQLEAKVGPIGLLFGGVSLAGEYIVNDEFGAELHTFFADGGGIVWATAKYYLNPRLGADRFHIGAFLAAGSGGPGVGFMIGTKAISTSRVVFDFGIGLGRGFDSEFIPYGKIQVGYRFRR